MPAPLNEPVLMDIDMIASPRQFTSVQKFQTSSPQADPSVHNHTLTILLTWTFKYDAHCGATPGGCVSVIACRAFSIGNETTHGSKLVASWSTRLKLSLS